MKKLSLALMLLSLLLTGCGTASSSDSQDNTQVNTNTNPKVSAYSTTNNSNNVNASKNSQTKVSLILEESGTPSSEVIKFNENLAAAKELDNFKVSTYKWSDASSIMDYNKIIKTLDIQSKEMILNGNNILYSNFADSHKIYSYNIEKSENTKINNTSLYLIICLQSI